MKPLIRSDALAKWLGWIAFALLLGAFYFAPLNTLRFGGVAIGDFFVIALICLVPFSILLWGLPKQTVPLWMFIAFALFAGSLLLTILFPFEYDSSLYERLTERGDPYSSSVVVWVRLVFAVLVFPVVVALLVRDWGKLKWMAAAWVAGVCTSCLVAMADAGLGTHVQESLSYDAFVVRGLMGVWADVTEYQRFVGLTDHPNTLGITSAMAIPIMICWLRRRRNLFVVVPVLLILLAGVFLSGSRAALLGLAAGVLALLFLYREPLFRFLKKLFGGRQGRIRLVALVCVGFLGLAGIAALLVSRDSVGPIAQSVTLERIFDSDTAEVSNEERSSSLDAALDAVAASPVVGAGFIWIEMPHNIVLAMLMSGGILALAAFIWTAVGYLRMGSSVRFRVPTGSRDLMAASIASFAAYLVMSPFINQSFNRYLYLPVALLMLGWVLLARQEQESQGQGD